MAIGVPTFKIQDVRKHGKHSQSDQTCTSTASQERHSPPMIHTPSSKVNLRETRKTRSLEADVLASTKKSTAREDKNVVSNFN